jgi:site-specific recombinase XerD
MENEFGFHGYDRRLTYMLQRVNPEKFGVVDRKAVNTVRVTSLDLTLANRESLSKYYVNLVNEGLTKPRIISLLDQNGRLLEWLGKDYSEVNEEDIKKLIMRVRTADLSEYTKSDYLVKLKRFDKWFNGGEEYSALTRRIKTTIKTKDLKLPSQMLTPEEAKELVEQTTTTRNRALLHLLWETGARVGELALPKKKLAEILLLLSDEPQTFTKLTKTYAKERNIKVNVDKLKSLKSWLFYYLKKLEEQNLITTKTEKKELFVSLTQTGKFIKLIIEHKKSSNPYQTKLKVKNTKKY